MHLLENLKEKFMDTYTLDKLNSKGLSHTISQVLLTHLNFDESVKVAVS